MAGHDWIGARHESIGAKHGYRDFHDTAIHSGTTLLWIGEELPYMDRDRLTIGAGHGSMDIGKFTIGAGLG